MHISRGYLCKCVCIFGTFCILAVLYTQVIVMEENNAWRVKIFSTRRMEEVKQTLVTAYRNSKFLNPSRCILFIL